MVNKVKIRRKKKEVSEVDQGSDHQSLANNKIFLLKSLQEIPAHYRDPVHRKIQGT